MAVMLARIAAGCGCLGELILSRKHIWVTSISTALVAFVLACGGGDDDGNGNSGGAAQQAAPTTASSDSAPTGAQAPAAGDTPAPASDGAPGEDVAVVSVGDTRYEFDVSTLCLSAFGTLGAAGRASDGSDVDLSLDLPPENWQTRSDSDWKPPSVWVNDDANNLDWRAGGEVVTSFGVDENLSRVTSFDIDGSRASGTAVFIDFSKVTLGQVLESVEGSFEVSCDGDPYS
jgi:hypothetical protein